MRGNRPGHWVGRTAVSRRVYSEMPDIFSVRPRVLLPSRGEKKLNHNALKRVREGLLISKAELARKAGVSPITIDRVEKGMGCRMETKRKIIFGLGLDLSDKEMVFPGS